MHSVRDIAWLAGLLEGEGCFSVKERKGCRSAIRIQLNMTDEDVVQRAAAFLGTRCKGPYAGKRSGCKPYYCLEIVAHRAAGWMMTLCPLMGVRRQAQIEKCLAVFKAPGIRPPMIHRKPVAHRTIKTKPLVLPHATPEEESLTA